MKNTKTRGIQGRNYGYKKNLTITAEYGFVQLGTQEPYFSLTGFVAKTWPAAEPWVSCGCIHNDIIRYFPKLEPLVKWHLVRQGGIPMHYVENTMFWFKKGNFENAKHSSVWGILPDDGEITDYTTENLEKKLAERLSGLNEAFNKDMDTFGIERITD
jgi:hypothetical protein